MTLQTDPQSYRELYALKVDNPFFWGSAHHSPRCAFRFLNTASST